MVPRNQANDVPEPARKTVTPEIGQIVYFYPDARERGMKSNDYSRPFAAIVADVLSDRLVNLLVIDHNATTFASQSVALFQGDDQDDQMVRCHCEFEPPAPKEAAPDPVYAGPVAGEYVVPVDPSDAPYVPPAEAHEGAMAL